MIPNSDIASRMPTAKTPTRYSSVRRDAVAPPGDNSGPSRVRARRPLTANTAPSRRKLLSADPLRHMLASVSVGIVKGTPVIDLDYAEDSTAGTDMNFVMTEAGGFIEIQGTAEGEAFSAAEMQAMTALAQKGIAQLIEQQRAALAEVL